MSKYDPLREFLKHNRGESVELTVKQINIILRDELPDAAYMHYAFWRNMDWGTEWRVSTHAENGKIAWVQFIRE